VVRKGLFAFLILSMLGLLALGNFLECKKELMKAVNSRSPASEGSFLPDAQLEKRPKNLTKNLTVEVVPLE